MTGKKSLNNFKFLIFICNFTFYILNFTFNCYAEDKKVDESITVNGDTVEYLTENKEVTVTGNAEVIYKGMKLTCDRLRVNTQTKDAVAEGNARLEEEKGVIEGPKIIYNFENKSGTIIDADFRSNPYFGRAGKIYKVSDDEFIGWGSNVTTCNYDYPHYRIKSRKINFFPGDKIKTADDIFYLGRSPIFYLPQYSHSLRDPLLHVQLMPGKSKDWGVYMLSAWRYSLAENVTSRIYFDYRERLGAAEGLGSNYSMQRFGKGDFKYYYTQERPRTFEEGQPAEFQRYFIRWRHKWEIDKFTDLTSEYYKIVDSKRILLGSGNNFLKDYFAQEYRLDSQPLSYVVLHRSFPYSSLDVLMQKRVNRWYSQAEALPEIKYSLPHISLGDSPFYFEHNSSYVNYNYKNAVPSDSWNDTTYNQLDTTNRISLPTKIAFINLDPFASGQETYNDSSIYGATSTVVFSAGSDISTKFYRLFKVKSNFLGMDINNLRHIITPAASYSYSNTSTMPAGKLRFGGGASTGNGSPVSLELSNKLQTKRKGQSVDIADLDISTTYTIKPKTGAKRGSSFSDFLFELRLLPYSWMTISTDVTYKHTDKYATGYRKISNANYDIDFNLGEERTIGFSQRYQRKGGNVFTYSLNWRFNPKWRFSLYQQVNTGHSFGSKRGLREQEYVISRDLHCWTTDFTYNVTRGHGESVWLVFRLKAFPELEFEYNQSYHAPKPGSQSNP
ncbi:MAG: LPS-assembly protein LptD [Candidatus Omnitrophica bacterium]|nr:LPS-assembly protein LptD [Candidatus Omnitrophota bacterium]